MLAAATRMRDSDRRWLGTAILVGGIYLAVGIASSALAGAATSHQMRLIGRWSGFIVSGGAFAVHFAYEHFRLRSSARPAAWHTSVAVAAGAFGLAFVANMRDLGSASGYRLRMLTALAAWPLVTAVPAFVVALLLATVLGKKQLRD